MTDMSFPWRRRSRARRDPVEIDRTDLDGLATFWGEDGGPARAWLVFRVGAADETLSTRGVTRLVAGLAMDGVAAGNAAYGAVVGAPTTAFELTGTRDQVVTILRRLWNALASTSVGPLEEVRERELLHSSWRVPTGDDQLLALRFGPHGAGLVGQPELGLHVLDEAAVLGWRERYFAPANAALALANVSPDDLSLAPRAPGEPRALPAPTPRPLRLPAWFEDGLGEIAVSSVQPASAAVDAFTSVAVRRLRSTLGDAHGVEPARARISPGLDHLAIHCDAADASGAHVRDALIGVLEDLGGDGPTEAEVTERRRELVAWRTDPGSAPARLASSAHRRALDPEGTHWDALDESDPPAQAAVAEAARAFLSTALYRLPTGVSMPASVHPMPRSSAEAVTGRTFEHAGDASSGSLVVGADGVTVTLDGRMVTVRFDRCEAVVRRADGTLDLYGSDGFGLQVRPDAWVDGDDAVAAIAARAPGLVEMRARPAGRDPVERWVREGRIPGSSGE